MQVYSPETMQAVSEAGPQNSKTQLIIHLQRHLKRTLRKEDLLYETAEVGGGEFQSIVKLACYDDKEFFGDPAENQKAAEKNAAHKALICVREELSPHLVKMEPPSGKKPGSNKKRRLRDLSAPARLTNMVGGKGALSRNNGESNPKSDLIIALQGHCKHTMAKGDIAYEVVRVGGKLFQATVRLNCWQGQEYTGEPSRGEKEAERSAAQAAYDAVIAEFGVPEPSVKKLRGSIAADMGGDDALADVDGLALAPAPEGRRRRGGGAGGNYKNELVNGLHQHCKRSIGKLDIQYTVTPYGDQFAATVKLLCLDELEFTGELCDNEKAAEQSAAQQALAAKTDWGPPVPGPAPGPAPVLMLKPMVPRVTESKRKAPEASRNPDDGNPKTELIQRIQKHIGRPLRRGDLVYETVDIEGQFEATLTLGCDNGRVVQGEVRPTVKEAEKSAAAVAFTAYAPVEEFKRRPPRDRGQEGKRLKTGKGQGGVPFITIRGAKAPLAFSLPGAQRQVVDQGPVFGEVTDWSEVGQFGWIKPYAPINHARAEQREGKIYVHVDDLVNVEVLNPGVAVQCRVYCDAQGLGASEVVAL